jgi:hypothetical protein
MIHLVSTGSVVFGPLLFAVPLHTGVIECTCIARHTAVYMLNLFSTQQQWHGEPCISLHHAHHIDSRWTVCPASFFLLCHSHSQT